MNLRQLQYFYDAAQTSNLAKTAEKYMVPASTVSTSIKRLEEELGVQLFTRTSNRIILNQKGKILANELRTAFNIIDDAVARISSAKVEHSQIRILIHARSKWITNLITEYKAENPHINFIISNDYALSDFDSFDIIVDEEKEAYDGWNRFLLSVEMICVKAAASNPLTQRELTFRQLKNEGFVLPSPGNGMRDLYEKCCTKHGIKPNIAIECNEWQFLQHYVSADMGLTVGSYRALDDIEKKDIAPLKVIDFDETQFVYVFYKDTHNIYIKEFCDFLYQKRYV